MIVHYSGPGGKRLQGKEFIWWIEMGNEPECTCWLSRKWELTLLHMIANDSTAETHKTVYKM